MIRLIIFSILIQGIVSCSSQSPKGKTAAEKLYNEALEYKKDKNYIIALEKINKLRAEYPYSFYTTHAELLSADVLYAQENYDEAAAAYITFRDMHPKSKKIVYVIWMIAQSYYQQLPSSLDRDLSVAQQAIKYYDEILNKFTKSEYVNESKIKKSKIKEMLRGKDKYIADFYFKTGVFDSARFRYLDILDIYKDKELRNHSILRILKASFELKDFSSCLKYAKKYKKEISTELKKTLISIQGNCQSRLLTQKKIKLEDA